uniref:Uncharacterized protein n=1 Tax=Oryza sativa subsp. japonica TaxID=39947 RepID=Q2QSQ9_ORYSJ|nr:hypothetical protein LOC_Os12g23260 [Oryza sativa Japonica Group]
MAVQRRWLLSPLAMEVDNGHGGGSKPSRDEVASTTARREGGRWRHDSGGLRALSPWRWTWFSPETLAKRRYLGSALRRVTVFKGVIVAAPVQHWARLLPRTPYNIDRARATVCPSQAVNPPLIIRPLPHGTNNPPQANFQSYYQQDRCCALLLAPFSVLRNHQFG